MSMEKEQSKKLLIFAMAGDLDGVKQLAEAGACINCYNKNPLEAAIEGGHLEIVKYLLSRGALIHIDFKNGGGTSETLWLAAKHRRLDIIKCLLESRQASTYKPRDFAAAAGESDEYGYDEITELLRKERNKCKERLGIK